MSGFTLCRFNPSIFIPEYILKIHLIHWLKAPEFPGDDRKTQQAHVMHVTIMSFLLFIPLAQIGIWLSDRTPAASSEFLFALFIVSCIGYYGIKKGYITLTGVLFLALTFILLTLAVAKLGTVRSAITTAYYAIIIISGLLFDLPGIIVMISMSSLAIGGLIIAQNAGMLPPPDPVVTITQWFIYTSLFITNGGLTITVIRSMRSALQRAGVEILERKRVEEALRISEDRLQNANTELQNALDEVKTLSGMLPICAHCKKIRDDNGYWNKLESYISKHTDATFTHGICPDCAKEFLETIRNNEPPL